MKLKFITFYIFVALAAYSNEKESIFIDKYVNEDSKSYLEGGED